MKYLFTKLLNFFTRKKKVPILEVKEPVHKPFRISIDTIRRVNEKMIEDGKKGRRNGININYGGFCIKLTDEQIQEAYGKALKMYKEEKGVV